VTTTQCRPPAGRFAALRLTVLVALALSGCRCGGGSAKTAEELLPPGEAALLTSPLAQVAASAKALLATAGQLPGGEQLGPAAVSLAAQLGVDLLSRDGQLAAGLDPDRGAALTVLAAPVDAPGPGRAAWIVALPLTRPEVAQQKLEQLLQQRAGFAVRSEEVRGGASVVVFARPSQGQGGFDDRIALSLFRGYLILARSPDPASLIAAVGVREAKDSLAQSPALARARQELGPQDLIGLVAQESRIAARRLGASLPGEAAIGLSVDPAGGLRLRLAQGLDAGALTVLHTLLPPGAVAALPIPKDAIDARIKVAPGQLPALLERVWVLGAAVSRLRDELRQKGVDLDQDLFAALEPGVALSLGLSAHANLGRSIDPALLDLRARSPFDLVRLVATARTRKAGQVQKALAALVELLPAHGATVERLAPARASGAPRFQGCSGDGWMLRYPGGEGLEIGLVAPDLSACRFGSAAGTATAPASAAAPLPAGSEALLYMTGGGGGDQAALAAALATPAPAPGDAAIELQLDLSLLTEAIHALPDSAYGTGPQVFVARSLVSQLLDPVQRLRARVELRPSPRGATLDLAVSLAPAAAPRP
jgi:hypothetical protein